LPEKAQFLLASLAVGIPIIYCQRQEDSSNYQEKFPEDVLPPNEAKRLEKRHRDLRPESLLLVGEAKSFGQVLQLSSSASLPS